MPKEVKYEVAAYGCWPDGVGRSRQLYGRIELSHAAGASAVGFACDGQYCYIDGLQQDRPRKKEREPRWPEFDLLKDARQEF